MRGFRFSIAVLLSPVDDLPVTLAYPCRPVDLRREAAHSLGQ